MTNQELMQQRDDRVAKLRAAQGDTAFNSLNPAQQNYFNAFNNAQEDAATGPAGYNRQWVPLLESLAGKRFAGGGGLPTERYADPLHTGHLTLQTANPSAPMPLDQDAFQAQWEQAHPLPAATPTTVLKQRATTPTKKPLGLPSPTFSLDALQQRVYGGGT